MTGIIPGPNPDQNLGYGHSGEGPGGDPTLNEGLGRNEGTVRFLFGAEWN